MTEQILRHPNGGARKVGLGVHVSADTQTDWETVVEGRSSAIGSVLTKVSLIDSHVFQSSLRNCFIKGSVVSNSWCLQTVLRDCVLDRVSISHAAGITAIELEGVVAEKCDLYGVWELKGNARIPCGTWRRAPRFLRITGDNGVDVGLTESTDGHALMACWRKPLTTWIHAGPRLGVKHRWTEEQIQTAKQFFEQLLDQPMET